MRITGIGATYSRTFNLGQFNSMKIEVSADAVLEDGDTPDLALTELLDHLAQQVKTKAMPVIRHNIDEVRQIIAGLPPEVRASLVTEGGA